MSEVPLALLPRVCPLCGNRTIIGHGQRLKPAHDQRHERIRVRRGLCLYASEMLRAGVGFTVLMKLLGHTDPGMTLCYLEVAAADLHREYQLARSKPQHLVPPPKTSPASVRTGLDGVIDSLVAAQHRVEMFRRSLPDSDARNCLDRLSNRLTKIVAETRRLATQ